MSKEESWPIPEPLIVPLKGGGYAYNLKTALEQYDLEVREQMQAARDLARLGVLDPAAPPGVATPRDTVHAPAMPGMTEHAGPASPANVGGLGDIHTQATHPGERYWEQFMGSRARPQEKKIGGAPEPITCPKTPLPKELEPYRTLIDSCFVPVWKKMQDEFLRKMRETLKCATIFTQPTTWLAPPVTAITIDAFTPAAGVVIPGGAVTPFNILRIQVPDRFVVVLESFGNQQEAGGFGGLRWSMQRNKTPIRSYGNFDVQLGPFIDPTKFGSPIILKSRDDFRLVGIPVDGLDHTAFARIKGWAFAARTTTGGGGYDDFHTF